LCDMMAAREPSAVYKLQMGRIKLSMDLLP